MAQTVGEMGKGEAFLDHRIALRKKAEAEFVTLMEALKKAKIETVVRNKQLKGFKEIEKRERQRRNRGE